MPLQLPKINLAPIQSGQQVFEQMLSSLSNAELKKAQTQKLNIQNQYLPQMQQEQLSKMQIQNEFAPLMQQEQLRQMQFRNEYQQLVNKYYPELTEARVGQMGRTGQLAGSTPLMRAFQVYRSYADKYGENNALTQEAKKNYNLMQNQVEATTNWRNKITSTRDFSQTPTAGKVAQQLSNAITSNPITNAVGGAIVGDETIW